MFTKSSRTIIHVHNNATCTQKTRTHNNAQKRPEIQDLLWERVKEPCPPSVGEGHPHSRHQWRVENHTGHLILDPQVNSSHSPDALSVQYDLVWGYIVLVPENPPSRFSVSIHILLRRFPSANAVAGIVECKHVTIYS